MDTNRNISVSGARPTGEGKEGTLMAAGYDRFLLGESPAMKTLVSRVAKAAPLHQPVLITGEPGTGKALVARAIHFNSPNSESPFIVMDCLAVPKHEQVRLIFGCVRPDGEVEKGLLEKASGGSLFLEEVALLADDFQAKLLQILRDKAYTPAGTNEPTPLRTRIFASSCRVPGVVSAFRLDGMNAEFGIVPIHVPPLRERVSDIPVLLRHFLTQAAMRRGLSPPAITRQAMTTLEKHSWPGNVDELIQVAYWILAGNQGGDIGPERLPGWLGTGAGDEGFCVQGKPVSLEELEKKYIRHILDSTGGGIQRAAAVLDINRKTLSLKMKKYGLSARDSD